VSPGHFVLYCLTMYRGLIHLVAVATTASALVSAVSAVVTAIVSAIIAAVVSAIVIVVVAVVQGGSSRIYSAYG
jgi:hypothetical protein